MESDPVAGDPTLDRVERHLGEVDRQEVGQLTGGDGGGDRHPGHRQRHRQRRRGGGWCDHAPGRIVHVGGDDATARPASDHRAEIDAEVARNPPGVRRAQESAVDGRGSTCRRGGDRRSRGGLRSRCGRRRRGRRRCLWGHLTVREQQADALAAREDLTDPADLVEDAGAGRAHLGLGLVGLDQQDRGVGLDGGSLGDEPLEDRCLLHREAEFGHGDISGHGGSPGRKWAGPPRAARQDRGGGMVRWCRSGVRGRPP